MSFFAVTIEKIGSLHIIENADNIELAKLEGIDFQFVVKKCEFKVGQKVIYFPLDAIIPNKVLELIGLEGRLAGSGKNRVKTIKLRGQISQGIVADISLLNQFGLTENNTPEEITTALGIVKYELPDPADSEQLYKAKEFNRTKRRSLPAGQSVYDIEGCERNANAVLELALERDGVYITEKLEGMNFSLTLRGINFQDCTAITHYSVNTRQCQLDYDAEHPFYKTVEQQGLQQIAHLLLRCFEDNDIHSIILYGEFIGPKVQGNIYKLQEHKIYLFDISVDGQFMDPWTFIDFCDLFNINRVPLLAINYDLVKWINNQMPADWLIRHPEQEWGIKQCSDGQSALYPCQREGIVIKPMKEKYSNSLHGRLFLKQRSPVYLSKEK